VIDVENLRQFVKKFNRFKGLNPTENFLFFYSTFIESLTDDESLRKDTLSVIQFFVERIRIIDNMLDEAGYPLNVAFPLVFPETQDFISQKVGAIKQNHLKSIETSHQLMKRANAVVKRRFSNDEYYNQLVCENLIRVYSYGEKEATAKARGMPSLDALEHLLVEYNCDFYLYNSITFDLFFPQCKPHDINLLRKLMTHYLIIDGILDSCCDLFDDRRYNSFNFLLYMLADRRCEYIRHNLLEHGVYRLLFDIAEVHYNKASVILTKIKDETIRSPMSIFLEGAWQGLSISEQNFFFVDLDPTDITKYEKLLYKPHPWEIVAGWEIIEEQNRRDNKIRSEICGILSKIELESSENADQKERQVVESYYEKIRSKKLDKDIIILRTSGCSRAFLEGTKCHHCGISKSYYTNAKTQTEILDSFSSTLSRFLHFSFYIRINSRKSLPMALF